MNPNVDVVDILSIRELASAPLGTADETWLGQICNPATGTNYKVTYSDMGAIISAVLGAALIEPDRVYIAGQPGPIDPDTGDPVEVTIGESTVEDSYLDGKVFSLELRGIGFLNKGVEWDNDVVGGGWRLLNGTVLSDTEFYTAHFHPQISNILSAPGAIGKFSDGIQVITSDTAVTAAMFRKIMILLDGYTITLNADYPENVIHSFIHNGITNKQAVLTAPAGQVFSWNGTYTSVLWLGRNEQVELIRVAGNWFAVQDTMGYNRVGHIVAGRLPGANQVIAQGQELLRADYPRLLDYLNRLNTAYPGSVVNAAQWSSNRTLWGFGNGTTTIRVPDLRGYFLRWLDLGAGVDVDRNSSGIQNNPGSSQGMKLEAHNHTTGDYDELLQSNGQGTVTSTDPGAGQPNLISSQPMTAYGGTETRPINAAELPLIYV